MEGFIALTETALNDLFKVYQTDYLLANSWQMTTTTLWNIYNDLG